MKFLVVLDGCWGLGDTAKEALAKAKKHGGAKATPRIVYTFDPAKTEKAYIDSFGALCWYGEHPALVEKVGFKK